jgi:hypothetical protein
VTNGVELRVRLVGECVFGSVILAHESQSLALVERLPFVRVGGLEGIVGVRGNDLFSKRRIVC